MRWPTRHSEIFRGVIARYGSRCCGARAFSQRDCVALIAHRGDRQRLPTFVVGPTSPEYLLENPDEEFVGSRGEWDKWDKCLTGLAGWGLSDRQEPEGATNLRVLQPPRAVLVRRREDGALDEGRPMTMRRTRGPAEPRFIMTIYEDGRRKTEIVTVAEIQGLEPTDVDLLMDFAFGRISVRTRNGRVSYAGALPAVGPIGLALLFILMRYPGMLFSAYDIGRATGIDSLYVANCVSARLSDLRAAFNDAPQSPLYIRTHRLPYRLAWPSERSYCVIEPLVEVDPLGDDTGSLVRFHPDGNHPPHNQAA